MSGPKFGAHVRDRLELVIAERRGPGPDGRDRRRDLRRNVAKARFEGGDAHARPRAVKASSATSAASRGVRAKRRPRKEA